MANNHITPGGPRAAKPTTKKQQTKPLSHPPTVSARLLHRSLGLCLTFAEWQDSVVARNPSTTQGTGLSDRASRNRDCSIALGLAFQLAMQAQTLDAMLVTHAIWTSGYCDGQPLQEPIADSLARTRERVFAACGLIDARKLQRFLEVEGPIERWMATVSLDFDLAWGVDYFCNSEVNFWEIMQTGGRLEDDLRLSLKLATNITRNEYPHSRTEYWAYHYFSKPAVHQAPQADSAHKPRRQRPKIHADRRARTNLATTTK
jgi:hypothetical protein